VVETKQIHEVSGQRAIVAPPGDEQAVWRAFAEATTVEDFYRGWLAFQCRLIPGVGGGVIFGVGASGVQSASPLAVWGTKPRVLRSLHGAAQRALVQRSRLVVQYEVDSRPLWAVAFPVQAHGNVVATVALALGPRPEDELEGALRQLEWGSGWLEALALRQTAAGPSSAVRELSGVGQHSAVRERLQGVLDLVASAQGHERFADAATAFVTELATRLDCDRVSIGFVRRRRARVSAVSHTAHLGSRTNLLRAIGAAMDEAIDQKDPVAVPPLPGAAPRVCRAHDELARQGAGGSVCTVPFASGSRIVGALTFELRPGRPFDAGTLDFVEAVAGLAGPGLEMLRRENRWLAVKALDAASETVGRLLGPGHLALKLGTLATLATAALLCFVTGDYRVAARAVMEAGMQRAAVAPFSGYISEAPVRAADLVRAGQVLAVLDDRELRLERAKLESQRDQLERQRALALAQGNAAQINIARAQIEQTVARMALVDDQLGKTRVVAGFDGVIVTGDLRESLGAPVDKGQVLFEIAPLDAYRLVVQVDERDIKDVVVGQRGQLRLASAPFDPVPFMVEKIVPVATARDGRNFFRVEARLEHAPERLRPGMEGVAKIEIERRRLAAIWTRSALDWARLTLWTWLP
jgi:RND family efflux transporter MFP subunit